MRRIHDADAIARYRAAEARWWEENCMPPTVDADGVPVFARPCTVPVAPGNGQAAYREGCEDEWIDRMRARYGEEY